MSNIFFLKLQMMNKCNFSCSKFLFFLIRFSLCILYRHIAAICYQVKPGVWGWFNVPSSSIEVLTLVYEYLLYWKVSKCTMKYPKKNRFQSVRIAALCPYNIQREKLFFKKSLSMYSIWKGHFVRIWCVHFWKARK